jgi:hypothetical protein
MWSTVSARVWTQRIFTDQDAPELKMNILACNRLLWESDIGADVKAWTLENWERWEEEKPEWFTPVIRATAPDEYIPPRFLVELGGFNRERRGSAVLSVRESMRRLSFSDEGGERGAEVDN